MSIEEAYEHCREITRLEARNFYYGFVLLPATRRAGIYAAYALPLIHISAPTRPY